MMLKVISNASPLIALTGINLLHILNDLWKEIIIPEAVYKEVVTNGEGKPGVAAIKSACKSWIKVVSARNKQEIGSVVKWRPDKSPPFIVYQVSKPL